MADIPRREFLTSAPAAAGFALTPLDFADAGRPHYGDKDVPCASWPSARFER